MTLYSLRFKKMPNTDVIVCLIFLTAVGVVFSINKAISAFNLLDKINQDYSWIIHGIQNILGYSTIILPGYLVYRYIKKVNYLDKPGSNYLVTIIRKCFGEDELADRTNTPNSVPQPPRTLLYDTFLLLFYFTGLQVSFLTWGVLQEKVMTQKYTNDFGNIGYFTDSQFLVFVNRILAFCMSGIVIICTRQPRHKSPLFKYAFCSLSNILSSWCQYEALKYVSFLHQVLAKAAKTIPVMIMGKLISRTKYDYYEYVSAVVLSFGMLFFMLDAEAERKGSSVTTLSGIVLLFCYIAFDSFTSNWQGALFNQYGMSPVQMMCAVNLFSCIFTGVSLLQLGGFVSSIRFMIEFPSFTIDCLLLSICSAAGQLFIFRTISAFGPLIFAIITTIRQGFSVLLSCIIYHHSVYSLGIFGIIMVFFSVFLRIYCGYRVRKLRKRAQNASGMKI